MATHSSILTWKIPWAEEPGGLQSMGSQRVRHEQLTKQQTMLPTDQIKETDSVEWLLPYPQGPPVTHRVDSRNKKQLSDWAQSPKPPRHTGKGLHLLHLTSWMDT